MSNASDMVFWSADVGDETTLMQRLEESRESEPGVPAPVDDGGLKLIKLDRLSIQPGVSRRPMICSNRLPVLVGKWQARDQVVSLRETTQSVDRGGAECSQPMHPQRIQSTRR